MERLAYNDLLTWEQKRIRKPLLLDGARQTGKTYLIDRLFGPREFRKVHSLDFRLNPQLSSVFNDSLYPDDVVSNIELVLNADVDVQHDLLFFDEIGECQAALDSLKYFAEIRPDIYLCASGSNIGLLTSFPVGKVQLLEIFPFCFEEFLMASGNDRLLNAYRSRERNQTIHQLLWRSLCEFYFVGGMPEAVSTWYEHRSGTNARVDEVSSIQSAILQGFIRDFGKYARSETALHIETVFRNASRQLSQYLDTSVQRFRFNQVIQNKNRYASLRGPIDWLEKGRLLWKCWLIESKPTAPLMIQTRENRFKLYLFDVGILGNLVGLTYMDHRQQDLTYKGFYAENFVATEYRSRVGYPMYGWQKARAEVEFLHRSPTGTIFPIEVKSGRRTHAKSLRAYIDRYHPERAIKFANVSVPTRADEIFTWPLYDVQFLADL